MTDLLQQGARWLEQQRAARLSSPVTYRRGGAEAEFLATYGRTEFQAEDESGLRVQAHVTDFLVAGDDFSPFFGQPQAGDRLVAGPALYEVLPLAGEGCWRWCDPYRRTLRIHARELGAA